MALAAGTLLTVALFEPDADASVGIGDALAPPLSRPTAPASWRSGRRHWRAIPAGPFETSGYPGILFLGLGAPVVTNSTIS